MTEKDLLIPTPDYVKARRLEVKLTGKELSRRMGYSNNYVGLIEQENLPVTKQFARRFWALMNDGSQLRAINAWVPLKWSLNGHSDVMILREPRRCACGCETLFVPNSWNHRFLSRKHRRRKRNG